MDYGILPDLTRGYILQEITQEQIFETYLNIKVDTKNQFVSPLRRDKNPTCSFYYNANGKLRLRDWSGHFWGDCFDIVGYLLAVNPNTKQGFAVILDKIARDFRLHKYSKEYILLRGNTLTHLDANVDFASSKKAKRVIDFKIRNWNESDGKYWIKGNITRKYLAAYHVYPAQYVWLDKQLLYTYTYKDPAYIYNFGNGDIRVYFPFRKEYRFIGNCSPLQGFAQMTCDSIGIVTKSYKDAISMRTFGIQACAPSSESVPISKDQYTNLKWRFDHIFSLMDFDKAGISMANKLRKLYGIQPLFFSRDKYKSLGQHFPNFGIKDFFEYVSKHGRSGTFELIESTKDKFSERFDSYNEERQNFLTHLATQDFYDRRKEISPLAPRGEIGIPSLSLK